MIFVTGGTGFLGSYLLYFLFRKGEKIRAMKRIESSFKQLELVFNYLAKDEDSNNYNKFINSIEWVEADVLDIPSIIKCLNEVNEIFHLAALVSFNPNEKKRIFDININGTANMINLAREMGIEKFHYVSSTAALNRNESNIIKEDDNSLPEEFATYYAQSKYYAELEVWRGYSEGLKGVIINPGVIIGPADKQQDSSKIFSLIQKGFSYYPDGKSGYIDVRDVASNFLRLSENPDCFEKRYLMVSESVTYKDLFDSMAKYFGVNAPNKKASKTLSYFLAYLDNIRSKITHSNPLITKELVKLVNNSYEFDNSKILNTLNCEFIPVEQTIKDTCLFLQSL